MAQAFVSTYKNHYRGTCQSRPPLYDPNKLTQLDPEGDIWMLDPNEEFDEELRNLPEIKEAIHRLYIKRMQSTYQVSYCQHHKVLHKSSETDINGDVDKSKIGFVETKDEDLENELLEYCKNLYGQKHRKLTPPLSSARSVFGYMRPTRFYTPLTVYQNEYGRVGYNILRSDKEMKKQPKE